MLRLPGLIDPHVHVREPGQTYKEDWDTVTQSALAGGVSMILAMPNTKPPIFDSATLNIALEAARQKAHCDYAQFLGAGPDNAAILPILAPQAAGLKMYLDSTFGELRLDDMTLWMPHFQKFPKDYPIVLHSESRTMAAGILFAALYDRPIHIAHISLKEEILLIKAAKEHGIKVTCEACPHHLFLSKEDIDSLWANMDVIDCFATDHAPHTLTEKDSNNPPPGFPGLETLLPLLLTAMHDGRLTLDDIVGKSVINPRKIFGLPKQHETWVEVDENAEYEIHAADQFTRSGWTPFEGWKVKGKVKKVVLRGNVAFEDGKVVAEKGYGRNVRGQQIL